MKKIFAFLCALIGTLALNAQQVDDVTLVTYGDGATKQDAINVALRSAIEQTFGTFVSANTDILNDELVKDEIVTVTSGNVRNYKELSSSKLDNGNYSVSLQATVSARNLTVYAQGKGAKTEFAGAMFGQNLKLWDLNTKNEKAAIDHLVAKLKPLVSGLVNYELQVSEPIAQEDNPNMVDINCTVTAKPTEAYKAFMQEIISTMEALALNEGQQEMGRKLGKDLPVLELGKHLSWKQPSWDCKYDEKDYAMARKLYDREYVLRSVPGATYLDEFLENVMYYLHEFQLRCTLAGSDNLIRLKYEQDVKFPVYHIHAEFPVDIVTKLTGLEVKRFDYNKDFEGYFILYPYFGESHWFQPIWERSYFLDFVKFIEEKGWRTSRWSSDILDKFCSDGERPDEDAGFYENAVVYNAMFDGDRKMYFIYMNGVFSGIETFAPHDHWTRKYIRRNLIESSCGEHPTKYRVAIVYFRKDNETSEDFEKWIEENGSRLYANHWSHRCNIYSYPIRSGYVFELNYF